MHLLLHCLSNLGRLYGIKLTDDQSLLAQTSQTLIEDTYHLVSVGLIDKAKPVLYFQPDDLLHHALVGNSCWVSTRIEISWESVIPSAMTRAISNMDENLLEV
jgi:hypothetical protein